MNTNKTPHIVALIVIAALLAATGCSTQKNTSQSRWWHSFNARYNTYYNGATAYVEGSLEKENGNKDNFTEMIPLYTVGNKASRDLGKGNFDRAIEKSQKAIKLHSIKRRPEWNKSRKKTEKDLEWLNRREYNPFLWKAWMLMGRSQFMKGSFDEAASTFAYMSRLYATQPAIYGKARAWLAKCYIEQDWLYDAEDVINKMRRDSIHWRARKEWDYTYADYYIRAGRFEEAIPYLRKVIKHEMRRKQRARQWYLMGQLQAALGHRQEAYKAFKRVVRQNPPYELEFNARIAMTEVMAAGKARQMIKKLKRMAASDNNKEYLDQVYYAIGNIHLAEKDTTQAIHAYETGNIKSTRSGIEKGVLLLHLGDLYWEQEKFGDARRCYGEAIGLLDKDRKDYEQLSDRSKKLDELVPYTDAIHLQDSLQALAKMPEKERNEAIDRVIEALKKKEKEERDRQAEAEAERTQAENGGMQNDRNPGQQQSQQQQQKGAWYFYNPMAVSQGKASFQKLWGKRENVDDWQRVNKTVVAQAGETEELTDEQRDSIAAAEAVQDSLENRLDSAQNNPHKREYYLAQIPFTPEQVEASNEIIKDGLFHAGVIFKDKLDHLDLSEKHLRRLTDQYADFKDMDEVFYHLFLLYSRKGLPAQANEYLEKLKQGYKESQWTTLLSDPYFVENAKYGVHIEDSLYAATYEAFKADRHAEIKANTEVSASRFPLGANRDKFIFIGGLGKLNNGDSQGCVEDMKQVVEKFPKSDVSPLAGMIINGVKEGRRLHGGKFDIGNVWERRAEVLGDSDSIAKRKFEVERVTPFVFVIAYSPDSVNENKLLFELARYNFTSYMVRNFDITIEQADGLNRMTVKGFNNYDEVLQYARQLYKTPNIMRLTRKARIIIISDNNLQLLGTHFSYNDYDKFYEKHFVPLKVSTVMLLTEPETIEYEKEPEKEPMQEDGLYNGGVISDDMYINMGIEPEPADDGIIIDSGTPAGNQPAETTGSDLIIDLNGSTTTDAPALPASPEADKQEPATPATTSKPEEKTEEKVTTEQPAVPSTKNGNVTTENTDVTTEQPAVPDAVKPEPKQPEPKPAVQAPEPKATTSEMPADMGGDIIIPIDEPQGNGNADDGGDMIIMPANEPATTAPAIKAPATDIVPAPKAEPKAAGKPVAKPQQPVEQRQQPQTETPQDDGFFIEFSDDPATAAPAPSQGNSNKKANTEQFDIEDEYYELEGF